LARQDLPWRRSRHARWTKLRGLPDINMPGMTGLEMLPKAREMRPDVPIIMITAYGDPETKRKAMEGGATGLLTKPIDFALLREEIAARLDRAI
jgi:CheY-like chemotaxis protein